MIHMGLIDAIRAEREREIESAIRNRRLLRPNEDADDAVGAVPAPIPAANENRRLAVRARPSGG